MHAVYQPDGLSAAPGVLTLVAIPGLSAYPVSAFVGEGTAASNVLLDLNNLYAQTTGKNLALAGGEVAEITEYRGLLCEPALHQVIRLRRLAQEADDPPVTQLKAAEACFSPDGKSVDFNCDGTIGFGDFNLFLGKFGESTRVAAPNCRFHSDFDINGDRAVDFGDFNLFLSVFGAAEPTPTSP